VTNLLEGLKKLWANEPIRVLTIVAAIATFIAAKFGIVVDQHSLLESLELVVPLLAAGEGGRALVTPVAKLKPAPTPRAASK
jgi:hypothetical protein